MDPRDRREIEAYLESCAKDFRKIAFEMETDPQTINRHLDLPGVQALSTMFIPEAHGAKPFVGPTGKNYFFMTCEERVISMEKLSYGDAGVLLASPGPSLSGYIINDLGTDSQKERFYSALLREPTWTFFGLTEPAHGSDAMSIETQIKKKGEDSWSLDGQKILVGNGTRAQVGVTFARYAPGPLGIDIALVDTKKSGYHAEQLNTLGMKGAAVSRITFSNYALRGEDIVGYSLHKPSQRGLWGAIRTFNRMRPGVAAIALGISQATHDYITENRQQFSEKEKTTLEDFSLKLRAVRQIIRRAAKTADANANNGYWGSIAKLRAVALAEEITDSALTFFGPASAVSHPFLGKWYRDVRGCEYMEGTANIQKLNVFQGFQVGKAN